MTEDELRKHCADIAFRSVQIKTGSIGCALQVRDDILSDRQVSKDRAEIAALHAKAKAVDETMPDSYRGNDALSTIVDN